MKEITTEITGTAETSATPEQLASSMGSGALPVFATPAMVALMENAAAGALTDYLENDETTVGTELNIAHTSATPAGMKVRAEAVLTAVNGREFTFEVSAYDEAGLIGKGTHKRFLVFGEKFLAKTNSKSSR